MIKKQEVPLLVQACTGVIMGMSLAGLHSNEIRYLYIRI